MAGPLSYVQNATQSIYLDMVTDGIPPRIHVSQYDNTAREAVFTLFNGAEEYIVPSRADVRISGRKPDGTIFDESCAYSGNTVTATIGGQMVTIEGIVVCELTIYEFGSNTVISSKNFYIVVEGAAVDLGKISEDSLKGLQEIWFIAVESAKSAEESAGSALDYRDRAKELAKLSESWAVGGTNTRTGEDNNNSKFYAGKSADSADESKTYSENSQNSAKLSESWAIGGTGKRVGEDENNSRYYAGKSNESAEESADSADESKTYSENSQNSAKLSESWAIGGTGERVGEDENNSKYYAGKSKEWKILSESYTHGGTGERDGEDTDNADYFSRLADSFAREAKEQADRAETYADFIVPHFILEDNRLYIRNEAVEEFTIMGNRLYVKITPAA